MSHKEKENRRSIDEIMGEFKREYGEGEVFHVGSQEIIKIPRWPIESPGISYVLGGGIPKGRIMEIMGPESSGKTSLAIFLAGQVQRQGGIVLYLDFENAADMEYAASLGLDKDKTILSQPDSGEGGLQMIQDSCDKGGIDIVIVDSVAAITPLAEIEGNMDEQ